jgi:putative transposase
MCFLKRPQPRAAADLPEIWRWTREPPAQAFDHYLTKYGRACVILKKYRDTVLTFYDFTAKHWRHLWTTDPIESTFATIRLRHRRTKSNGTRQASLVMMFKLAQCESKHSCKLNDPP